MARRPGSSNTLRLVAGRHGGRKLQFPDAKGLRPTADRVRETLFNWLAPVIQGSYCLDLYAGSGALGFEAVSRGAGHVIMVEAAAAVARQLKQNAQLLGEADRIDIYRQTAQSWLEQWSADEAGQQFDVVFLDPPFTQNLLEPTLVQVCSRRMIRSGGLLYVERDRHQPMPAVPGNCSVIRDKTAGQVAYSLIACQ